jgi:hypothetical protein
VDKDGKFAAVQFGFMDGSGNGQGIFLFDIEQYEKSKSIHPKEYHVSVNGNDSNPGSALLPFKTISAAALVAFPGDTITVHAGTYREWINPLRGGESETRRIIYRAAPGEKAEIKGSEIITGWKKEKTGVWKVVIPNSFFGAYNPYQDSVFGDWFGRMGRIHHTGEVFLNGKSLYEKETLAKVINPVPDTKIKDPEGSIYTWYCESDANNTTIWANFQKFNPNKELVEISTRRTCFYPDKPGVNYLTIRGFHISQAATQWGAPTAEQVGMIATHWNKGWIIENNVISDSKCSGITLGKERGTGHNVWSLDEGNVNRDGNIHYIEVVFRTLRNGWNKETIGSHIVRNNTIFNCEQTGICGSMGAAFSIIENNHIYDIWTKRQFNGAEIGGIKFHAAVDAVIRKNRIHDCGRGLWLDWMTQGTRVSGNLFYNNSLEDIFLEVNHGPFIVDNNILLSPYAIRTQSQGGAYLHNLIAGAVYTWPEPNRFTPYFLPHSTDMAGLTTILAGDDRYYNNIFVGKGDKTEKDSKLKYGTEGYNNAKLPVWMSGNHFYKGAKPSSGEKNFIESLTYDPEIKLTEDGENVYLQFKPDQLYYSHKGDLITSDLLGFAKIPKARFENTDGSSLVFDKDYFGRSRSPENVLAGPFSEYGKENEPLKVW